MLATIPPPTIVTCIQCANRDPTTVPLVSCLSCSKRGKSRRFHLGKHTECCTPTIVTLSILFCTLETMFLPALYLFSVCTRSRLLLQSFEPQEGENGTLQISGFLRFAGLSANQLISIPGAGDYPISAIYGPTDPFLPSSSSSSIPLPSSAAHTAASAHTSSHAEMDTDGSSPGAPLIAQVSKLDPTSVAVLLYSGNELLKRPSQKPWLRGVTLSTACL